MKELTLRIVLLSALILYVMDSNAQYRALGIKGGVNRSSVLSSGNFGSDVIKSKGGFTGGFTYEYISVKGLSFGVDLLYEGRGFVNVREDVTQFGVSPQIDRITDRFAYRYFSVPIRGGYYIGEKLYGFATIGLVPAFLLSSKMNRKTDYYDAPTNEQLLDTRLSRKLDVAGRFEVGVGYKMSWLLWPYASIAWQQGFTPFYDPEFYGQAEIRHSGWAFTIGTKLEFFRVRLGF
jgi:hypothetical protein